MNAFDIEVGADVLIGDYTYRWVYTPAKVVRTTKTWIIVNRGHAGCPDETFKKSNLKELNKGLGRCADLIIDPIKIKEALERQENLKIRKELEHKAQEILNRIQPINHQSDEMLNKIIALVS